MGPSQEGKAAGFPTSWVPTSVSILLYGHNILSVLDSIRLFIILCVWVLMALCECRNSMKWFSVRVTKGILTKMGSSSLDPLKAQL